MLNHIRNIIFDLGGVIINIDYQLTVEAFKKLGIENFDEVYSKARQSSLFDRLETGLLSDELFREELMKQLPNGLSEDEIDGAWNAMLLDFPVDRLEFIYDLRKHYRLFLLSNTNSIHVKEFVQIAERQLGANTFESAFEKIYYSCEIGMRKPDPSIFELVLEENGLKADETLFIDDSPQHIEGALSAGIYAEWLAPTETIEGKYAGLLISA